MNVKKMNALLTRYSIKKTLAAFFILCLFIPPVHAQKPDETDLIRKNTNTASLLKMAKELRTRMEEKKKNAIRISQEKGWPAVLETDSGNKIEIREIGSDGRPVYFLSATMNAARAISTDKLWLNGGMGLSLSGGVGDTIREWDESGVLGTHTELSGRVFIGDGTAGLSNHSTHVAGIMMAAGIVPGAHGMANGAFLRDFDWNTDYAEMAAEGARGALVSNHSYVYITGWFYGYPYSNYWSWWGDTTISRTEDYNFGFYSVDAATVDSIEMMAPYYLICRAAGNEKGEGPAIQPILHYISDGTNWIPSTTVRDRDGGTYGFDCASAGFGVSKNVLTVGAVSDITTGYIASSDVVLAGFSSTGPSDDGRIKPDIVSNGISLYSTLAGSNNSYGVLSGTSMATPAVTGSLQLLQRHYHNLSGSFMRASTLKALVIHTADEAGPAPGPDYQYGWGLLNSAKAAKLLLGRGNIAFVSEQTLNNGGTYLSTVNATGREPLRVTICWTDPPGTPPAPALNPPTPMLVNDLDLRVDGTTYKPWILDPANRAAPATTGDNFRDNVEQVYVQSPAPGNHVITVSHKGSLAGGSQVFSIIVSGIYSQVPDPMPFNSTASGLSEIDLKWTRTANNNTLVAVSATPLFGAPSNGSSYAAGNPLPGGGTVIYNGSDSVFRHLALSPATSYYYKAYSVNSGLIYSFGLDATAATFCTSADAFPITEDFNHAGNFPGCWTQQVSGYGNFTDWSVSNSTNAGGSGYEMKASQTFTSGVTRLKSVFFNTIGVNQLILSFRHVFTGNGPGAVIKIQSSTDGLTWTDESWSYASGSSTIGPELATLAITHNLNSPSTMLAFVISGNLNIYSNWFIDDVTIKAPGYWVGGAGGAPNDWNTAANWGDLTIPASATDVYIPARTSLPVITNNPSSPATCHNLFIEKNATVTVLPEKKITVNGVVTLRQ
jgi:hypothetical protein